MPSPGSSRNIIHIISRFSNWNKPEIKSALKNSSVYSDKKEWSRFLDLFLSIAGILLITAAIIFFFAYNWDSMSAFQKFLLVQALMVISCGLALVKKIPLVFRQVLLTASAVIAGTLWVVYGQVYQTGAEDFDFFLVWLLCIVIWIIAGKFPPLWLLGVFLANMTLYYFFKQDYRQWQETAEFNQLFLLNSFLFVLTEWTASLKSGMKRPLWFVHILAITAVFFMSLGIIAGIYEPQGYHFLIAIVMMLLLYPLYITWGFRERTIFPVAVTGVSLICILSSLLMKQKTESAALFFITGLYFIASTSGLIVLLVKLNKRWHPDT